jgi:hypothetical protein
MGRCGDQQQRGEQFGTALHLVLNLCPGGFNSGGGCQHRVVSPKHRAGSDGQHTAAKADQAAPLFLAQLLLEGGGALLRLKISDRLLDQLGRKIDFGSGLNQLLFRVAILLLRVVSRRERETASAFSSARRSPDCRLGGLVMAPYQSPPAPPPPLLPPPKSPPPSKPPPPQSMLEAAQALPTAEVCTTFVC